MKNFLQCAYCLLFILFSSNLFAQKYIKDNFKYKITYELTAKLDSTDAEFVKTEKMHLLVGDKLSSFSSRAMSVDKTLKIRGNSGHTSRTALTEFRYIIIKDREDRKLYYTQSIVQDHFYYEEKLSDTIWEIGGETKQYEKYMCQKATTTWRGRSYTAWFTEQIPISEGPYKFSGLPGLIVEIYDDEKDYHFKLTSFEKLSSPLEFKMRFKDFIEMTKEELRQQYLLYARDSFSYVNIPGVTVSISPEAKKDWNINSAKRLKQRNNHIELK